MSCKVRFFLATEYVVFPCTTWISLFFSRDRSKYLRGAHVPPAKRQTSSTGARRLIEVSISGVIVRPRRSTADKRSGTREQREAFEYIS